jgi:glucose/arabinose dehydrogenase
MHRDPRRLCRALVVAEPLERRQLLTVVSGFTESAFVAGGLDSPTVMEFAPDGRLFVAEQGGAIRVVQPDGTLNPAPFAKVATSAVGERGLIGLTLDPDFAENGFVYVYYTVSDQPSAAPFNRVSRFTAAGDVAVPGSEKPLFTLDPLSTATNHNGGGLHFGADGKLYVAVGENANPAFAQTLSTTLGKMLRINADGTIPNDNPFFNQTVGNARAIWALGLRNPFTFAVQPGTGRIFINDVGQNAFEEINDGIAGANYGWPGIEGKRQGQAAPAGYQDPLLAYGRTVGTAITGGTFYNPPAGAAHAFPAEYTGDYFYADFGSDVVRRFDPAGGADVPFASGLAAPLDIDVDAAGNLYVLNGRITRFASDAVQSGAPTITAQPASVTVPPGAAATFTVGASGSGTLRYQWQRNGVDLPGATSSSFSLPAPTAADNGAQFRAVVSNDAGSATSNNATLTVSGNAAPTATITSPAAGTTFAGGQPFSFAGTASDAEDGPLPDGAFSWRVDYVNGGVVTPFLPETPGVRGASFTAATEAPFNSTAGVYRITLTVTDSDGAATAVTRDLVPRTNTFTLRSEPAGAPLTLDGAAAASAVPGVVGTSRVIAAPATAVIGGVAYQFDHWSDGGAATHAVNSNDGGDLLFLATYVPAAVGGGAGLAAAYFDNPDFTGRSISRIDPAIDFDFAAGSLDPAIAPTSFSARWSAQVQPAFSEPYTFRVNTTGGARVTLNGQPLIDALKSKRAARTATIDLIAGQRYDLVVEYVQRKGPAGIQLFWSSPSTPEQIVPANNLFPPPGAGTTLLRAASADASTQDGKRSARPAGAARTLQVSAGDKAGSNREAFLTFDLTNLPDPTNATLTLVGKVKGKADASLGVFAVDDPAAWQESTLAHDARPATSASPFTTFTVARGAKRTVEIDLTGFLLGQKALGKTSISIALKSLTAGPVVTLSSREAKTGKPELRVTANG